MISLFPVKNFPNEKIAFLFSVIFIIILLIELRLLKELDKSKEDKSSVKYIMIGIFLSLATIIMLSFFNIGSINKNFSYMGIIILLSGFIVRQYSIKILGRYFVPVVSRQKNQKIIQIGPYRYIRHPSYAGLILELAGAALALSNIISLIAVLIFIIPPVLYRIKIEESFLIKNFKDYKAYQLRTKKLIPLVY